MNASELNLIIGCMFSGKTSELLRIAKRLKSIDISVLMINYHEDTRYSNNTICSHDNQELPSEFVEDLEKINYDKYDVICINEAQFFTGLLDFCLKALKDNKVVYVCGLDGDYKQEPFGELLNLIPYCDNITRLSAFCKICKNGTKAHFTKRITDSKEQKVIGVNEYIPVCRNHI